MSDKYILDVDWNPVPCPDLLVWGRWMQQIGNGRIVVKEKVGDCEVSTVFLGLDHSYGEGPPLLWETLVFGGHMDQEMDRCSGGKADARAMHDRMVSRVLTERACS